MLTSALNYGRVSIFFCVFLRQEEPCYTKTCPIRCGWTNGHKMSVETLLQPSTSPTTHYSMKGTTSTDTVKLSHAFTQACTFTLEDGNYIQAPILNCGSFYADFTKRAYHACFLFCCIRLYFPMGPITARLAKIERKLTVRILTLLFKNARATRLPYLIF